MPYRFVPVYRYYGCLVMMLDEVVPLLICGSERVRVKGVRVSEPLLNDCCEVPRKVLQPIYLDDECTIPYERHYWGVDVEQFDKIRDSQFIAKWNTRILGYMKSFEESSSV